MDPALTNLNGFGIQLVNGCYHLDAVFAQQLYQQMKSNLCLTMKRMILTLCSVSNVAKYNNIDRSMQMENHGILLLSDIGMAGSPLRILELIAAVS